MPIQDLVFVHGWGLNSQVWQDLIERSLAKRDDLRVHCIDLPGYGDHHTVTSSYEIDALTEFCLAHAPKHAIWVGWSLGGMVVLNAARMDRLAGTDRVKAMQLINTTPRFVVGDDWPQGVSLAIFEEFCRGLSDDYAKTLKMFLLLQAGQRAGVRDLVRQLSARLQQSPVPKPATLKAGIECLANTDLRDMLADIVVPTQIVCGVRDRVTSPECSRFMAQAMQDQWVKLVEMNTGHAPFLTEPQGVVNHLLALLDWVDA